MSQDMPTSSNTGQDSCSEHPPISLLDLPLPVIENIVLRCLRQSLFAWTALKCSCHTLEDTCKLVLAAQTQLASLHTLTRGIGVAAMLSIMRSASPLSLLSLSLDSCFGWIDDNCLQTIAETCPRLQNLSCKHCGNVTPNGIMALTKLKNLQSLSLASCRGIGDGSSLKGFTALTDLDLSWCHTLTSTGLTAALGPSADMLLRLRLHGCQELDCSFFCNVGLPQLEEVALAYTRVGDSGLMALAAGSPRLARLSLAALEGSYNLWAAGTWTSGAVAQLRRTRPELGITFLTC